MQLLGVGWGCWSGPLREKQGAGLSPEKQFMETHLGQDLIPMDAQSQSSRVWTLPPQLLASPKVFGSHARKGSSRLYSSLRGLCRRRQEGLCPAWSPWCPSFSRGGAENSIDLKLQVPPTLEHETPSQNQVTGYIVSCALESINRHPQSITPTKLFSRLGQLSIPFLEHGVRVSGSLKCSDPAGRRALLEAWRLGLPIWTSLRRQL